VGVFCVLWGKGRIWGSVLQGWDHLLEEAVCMAKEFQSWGALGVWKAEAEGLGVLSFQGEGNQLLEEAEVGSEQACWVSQHLMWRVSWTELHTSVSCRVVPCCGSHNRERAWKLKQAKRFVKSVKSSRLDVESRAEVGCLSG
jgi:hypothetical protein